MHEMGICQGILASSIEAAEKQGAVRIKEIRVDIGELTEVVEYALQFAFESLSPDTLAEGGTLVINHVPARSRCTQCGHEFDHGRFDAICPECGNPFNETIGGRELDIASIEVEVPDENEGAVPPVSAAASDPTDDSPDAAADGSAPTD
jgi:hydrogenase nickel incorporation protein HypA/HybF